MNIEFQIRKRPATLWMHAAVKAAAEAARNGADEVELAACFKPHARIAKRLLTKDWSLRGLAPPELFAALGGDRMSKAEDHYIHHLDFGDLQVDDRSLKRWFRAFLKALGYPQPAPRVERVGDILPLLIEQPPLAGDPGDCFADPGDLDWWSVPRFVLSLAIPGDSKHGVRSLSDSQMIDLVDRVAVELDLFFDRMTTSAAQDQADGDVWLEDKGQLIMMVKGLGPWVGCGEIELGLKRDGDVYRTINRALIAAFSPPPAPRLPERCLFGVEVGRQGIALIFRAVEPVDPAIGVEGFAQSPVCRALALMIERTSGFEPRLRCFTEDGYQAIDWDASPAASPDGLASLTELLKAHGVPLSAVKANRMLLEQGILEERSRRSRSALGGEKRFKAITEAGERYGINQENPNNPDETSPRWREDRFAELVERYLSSPE